MRSLLLSMAALVMVAAVSAAEPLVTPGTTFQAHDSLQPIAEPADDARECLDGLLWPPSAFQVRCESTEERGVDLLVRFPSARSSGDEVNDHVALEWHAARNEAGEFIDAPAIVVVHESASSMTVGRLFARGLRHQSMHAFMIHLPYYGARRSDGSRRDATKLVPAIRQGIADVRRARDAVAALPLVESNNISLQGTSLGAFVAATAAGLDNGYDQVFLMLAGGDLFDVIQNGEKDAAKFRQALAAVGLTGEKLKREVAKIEPTRLAHRIDPASTWLYSARFDRVVPPRNAKLLSDAAGLDRLHHIRMFANHYNGAVYLPYLTQHIRAQVDSRR